MSACYASLVGGVGNQLFIAAATYAYARRHDKEPVLCDSGWYALQGNHPNTYRNTLFKNFQFGDPASNVTGIGERSLNYTELPFEKGDVRLSGYFQSLLYFEDYQEDFVNLLDLPSVDQPIGEEDIAIHIRRGDYLVCADVHLICGKDYYLRAASMLNGRYNVFTDSPQLVLNEFRSTFDLSHIRSDKSDLDDLSFISKHQHVICSNSSFSWWASFLGVPKKTVIVPSLWIKNQPQTDIYANRKDFTIIPP